MYEIHQSSAKNYLRVYCGSELHENGTALIFYNTSLSYKNIYAQHGAFSTHSFFLFPEIQKKGIQYT